MKATMSTEPHSFSPLRPWDALRGAGRCRHCRLRKDIHPIRYWAQARPIGDKSPALETSFENLSR